MQKFLLILALAALLPAASCGGNSVPLSGSSPITPAGLNVQPLTVNAGPAGNYVNGLFTSVTVCVPATPSDCQTINGVLVDTGSVGLRLLASALTLALPPQTNSSANPIAECYQFVDGYTWGTVRTANLTIAGERATSLPIQLIGDPAFPTAPSGCTSTGLAAEDTLQTLGANGILGVGLYPQDCGTACTLTGPANPGLYYVCLKSGCVETEQSPSLQVPNPVSMFPADHNGVIIELPSVPSTGESSLAGSLIFGIGTQANNTLGNATIYAVDSSGNISTTYGNQSYTSFLDTGSNGLYILNASATGLAVCTDASSFYCPSSARNFTATNRGSNGTSGAVNFSVANADSLFATPDVAFSDLAGPNPGAFDWGLPFFFGRNVFTAIAGQRTPAGPGPYFAY